eukprot:scaffold1849_cov66-Phaeocystis_antarctica.AAC.1
MVRCTTRRAAEVERCARRHKVGCNASACRRRQRLRPTYERFRVGADGLVSAGRWAARRGEYIGAVGEPSEFAIFVEPGEGAVDISAALGNRHSEVCKRKWLTLGADCGWRDAGGAGRAADEARDAGNVAREDYAHSRGA